MDTKVIIYPFMTALLLTGCSEKNGTSEGVEAQNEMSGELHENDTVTVKRDGTLLDGTMDLMDSIPLPEEVLASIEKDSTVSAEEIVSSRSFAEGNQIYYEVTFATANDQTKKLIFDEKGKVSSYN
jgi:hypothetical protein